MKWLISFLGLKGSWKWACREMSKGRIVRRSTNTGKAHYRLDRENQRRIQWVFCAGSTLENEWENANIFLSDFECIDWVIE